MSPFFVRPAVVSSLLTLGLASIACGGGEADIGVAPVAPPPARPAPTALPTATAVASAPVASLPDNGDEGMWLLNDFPAARLERLHGFRPSKEWLDHVRLSAVRLARGCSGSVVSPNGLVMTNHHCAAECVQQVSTKAHDYMSQGYKATLEKDELKCPGMEMNQLVGIDDVTERVLAETRGKTGRDYYDALKGTTAKIEKECSTGDAVRCDVVTLYQGGRYHLYRYKRFQDIRLVFAPEQSIAFFGGDPDNFMFPRYDLDLSFLRIYEDGKPAKLEHYFKWSKGGVKEGDLTFVVGNPGRTSRLMTTAQLAFKRDVELPTKLVWLSEVRGLLTDYGARGKEEHRTSSETLYYVENSIKAIRGMHGALAEPAFFDKAAENERALRESAAKTLPEAAGAWDALAKAQADARRLFVRYNLLERTYVLRSELFDHARTLLRAADELPKKNEERLAELTDGKLPAVKAELFSDAPIEGPVETLLLTHGLTKLRELLGADDPVVKKVLGPRSPAEVAAAAVKGTKLKDKKVRKALFEGGKSALVAANDPMIALAQSLDEAARAVRKEWEDKVDGPSKKYGESIAKARFAAYGTSQYPDATFSMRLSYGVVKGWKEPSGEDVRPLTDIAGLYARATGREPFALPKTWLAAKDKVDGKVPFNFSTTNDIVGGNSGSPVVDQAGEVVGLIFDGNIHSLGGDFGYDAEKNRAVAVHSQGILHALDKVYDMKRVLAELQR